MRRPGDTVELAALEKSLPGLRSKVRFVEAPLLDIAAREIRRRIAEGRPFRYFLPERVFKLLMNMASIVLDRTTLVQPCQLGPGFRDINFGGFT